MSQPTPGPWITAGSYVYGTTKDKYGDRPILARAYGTAGGFPETRENARLMAAAPELLDALRALMEIVEDNHCVSAVTERACDWCGGRGPLELDPALVPHAQDCPFAVARALLVQLDDPS